MNKDDRGDPTNSNRSPQANFICSEKILGTKLNYRTDLPHKKYNFEHTFWPNI